VAAVDPYVVAKASLRDNVKTLIAVFGGIAGVLLAGTPFSGYGSLELCSPRWVIASLALLLSLVLLGWSIRRLLFVLTPDLAYTNLLVDETKDAEILAVQQEFAVRKGELLPKRDPNNPGSPRIDSVSDLINEKRIAWANYQADLTKADLKEEYDRLADALASINHWSAFTRLHVRVSRGTDTVFWIGLAAIVSIAVFALASNAPKKESAAAPTVYVVLPSSPSPVAAASPLPVLPPVLFATGKADLTSDAVTAIDKAREYLRTHAEVGVLVFANTDTMGGDAVNEDLARRRAQRVADLLRKEGGVSASRVFVAPLAKRDLPALTTPRTEKPANRAVEMILIPMPVRGP
jgi:outer membrane protein OmpA-like peptidoglycan-associated protein